MCRISEALSLRKKNLELYLTRLDKETLKEISFGRFTLQDRKTDHDPSAMRIYNMYKLPNYEKACDVLVHLRAWYVHVEEELGHQWRDDDPVFPALKGIPRQVEAPTTTVKWGSEMNDNTFTDILGYLFEASGITKDVFGSKIRYTAHCFRRGGAQYRFMFAPENQRWSLKMIKWWAAWSRNERTETLLKYLLDDIMDREEGELSDVFAPDRRITQTYASEEKHSNSTIVSLGEHSSVVMELQAIRSEMSALKRFSQVTHQANAKRPQLSSLPEVATWKDCVTQYWTADPSRHQFRAGCDFTAEEKRHYKTRLSRMKLIASYVRFSFDDDVQNCERFLQSQLGNELTVNAICKYLRQKKNYKTHCP
ncbi:hypothetical protein FI667_g7079, partial [Globisporangium splendens]